MTTAEIVILAGLIVLLGHFIKGLTGFASALFAIPLLALFLDIKFVVPVFVLFDFISGGILAVQTRRFIDRRCALLVLSGLIVGGAVGTYFLLSLGSETLKKVFGAVVILFALRILILENAEAKRQLSRIWAPLSGIAGGFTGAMFGLDGPPLVLYLAHQLRDKQVFRATLYGLFFAHACYRLTLYWFGNLITVDVIKFALYLTPFLLVGILLGSRLHTKISQNTFRKIIAFILVITGMLLVV